MQQSTIDNTYLALTDAQEKQVDCYIIVAEQRDGGSLALRGWVEASSITKNISVSLMIFSSLEELADVPALQNDGRGDRKA